MYQFRQSGLTLLIMTFCWLDVADGADQFITGVQGWQATSNNGVFKVKILPQAGIVPISKFHRWEVHLTHPDDDAPVYPARLSFSGGMMGHQHGLPTQPQVTEYLGAGRYLVEGVKFNMTGDWTIFLSIQTPETSDRVTIPIKIDY